MSDLTPIARRQQMLNNLGSPDTITSGTPIPITPQTINTTKRLGSLRSPSSRELLHPDVEALADNPLDDGLRTILLREYNIDRDILISGELSSPRRQGRGDIHPSRNYFRFSENEEDSNMNSTNYISPKIDVKETIWGTNIKLEHVKTIFQSFLYDFRRQYRQEKEGVELISTDTDSFYVQYMHKIQETKIYVLNLDTKNLLVYGPSEKLYHQLIRYPQDLIPIMDEVVTETYNELCSEQEMIQIKVRTFNLEKSINMRDLNPSDIDQMVSVKGLIIRTSPILPIMSTAYFRCSICNKSVEVTVVRGKIDEPSKCPRLQCNSIGMMSLIHNRSYYKDKQICRLQETPDCIPDGQTPHTITICLYDDLVDVIRPGDKVEITGIYRSFPIRLNPNKRTIKSLFKTFVDAIHISKTNKSRLSSDSVFLNENEYAPNYDETDDINCKGPETTIQNPFDLKEIGTIKDDEQRTKPKFTNLEISEFEELSRRPFIYETLANSLAPSIFGLDDVKKGILLQLFGGVHKKFEKSGSPRFRGDINILLVGDPGTGKSQLLQYVHKISPRGVYTSGKGSSAVGLTAYVTRDPDSKQMVLESGALVLSDGGICCIDEFDKMSEGTRAVLHEVMEQQTLSVAKAGIITTLNARASILASANPVNSKYDPQLSIVQNIRLPPTLMSRFDLIYLVLDKIDELSDSKLAKHLVSLYMTNNDSVVRTGILPFNTLSKYISYAKTYFNPKIADDATQNELAKIYVELRKLGQDSLSSEKIVTATPRQLESMIRLAEAHARMRLSNKVEIYDVREAERLLREAMKTAAWDPETGRIDMDLITTGHNINDRERGADKLLREDEENEDE